jgi:hypothetical protein
MNYRSDVVVWKMKSPTEIEWENPRRVSSVRMDNTRILMDNKFIVVAHKGSSDTTCDVYLMSKPHRKPNYIKLSVTHRELLFQDGFILVITDKGEIKYTVRQIHLLILACNIFYVEESWMWRRVTRELLILSEWIFQGGVIS